MNRLRTSRAFIVGVAALAVGTLAIVYTRGIIFAPNISGEYQVHFDDLRSLNHASVERSWGTGVNGARRKFTVLRIARSEILEVIGSPPKKVSADLTIRVWSSNPQAAAVQSLQLKPDPSLLAKAAEDGDTLAIERLLADGHSADERGWRSGETALFAAAATGQTDAIKLLLSKGANPNIRDRTGDTPLDSAVTGRHVEAVKLLISAGSDVNSSAGSGLTPLMYGVFSGDLDTVRELLQHGASPLAHAANGKTALTIANENHRTDMAQLLAAPQKQLGGK